MDSFKSSKLSRMSDQDIAAYLEQVEPEDSVDESEGDDDYVDDPDYICTDDEFEIDRLLESTDILSNAINISLNIDNLTALEQNIPENASLASITPSERAPVLASPSKYIGSKKRPREVLLEEEDGGPNISSNTKFSGVASEIRNESKEFKNILWKKKSFQLHVNELVFRGAKGLPQQISSLKTPYDCFQYFLTEDFIKYLVKQMNLYARQNNIQTTFKTDEAEMRKFFEILFFMSVYRFPNVRSFWGRHAMEAVRETMSRNRFEELLSKLHFNDNSLLIQKGEAGYDALYKIRPVIKHFNERFLTVPMRQRLCVDEQICSTKMQGNPTRQYMPAKPHKWGTKLFCLCDSSGFSYAFEVYAGAGDNIVFENSPDLGAASNVVVRLATHIPDNVNQIVYFDNYYTSLGLLTYLKSRGIYSLGTVRSNRIPNIKLTPDKLLDAKKVERGYSEEFVGTAYGIDIINVLWRDTKTVRLLSTYVGTEKFLSRKIENSTSKVSRWDRKIKQNVEISCPEIIMEYNKHMGGVDLLDGLIGRYRIRLKTRKWTTRIFFHLLDVAMVNSYILYHRLHDADGSKCPLPDFRTEVAETLCKLCTTPQPKRGRPLSMTPPSKPKRSYIPQNDIRYDQIGHWCEFLERSGKKNV